MGDVSGIDDRDRLEDDLLRTAQQHASMRVPVTSRTEGVSDLLRRMAGNVYDGASVVAVCEGDRLVGLATIEILLNAPFDAAVHDVMDDDPPTVSPDTHQEHVAWKAVQDGEPGIAVVDESGRFRGLKWRARRYSKPQPSDP